MSWDKYNLEKRMDGYPAFLDNEGIHYAESMVKRVLKDCPRVTLRIAVDAIFGEMYTPRSEQPKSIGNGRKLLDFQFLTAERALAGVHAEVVYVPTYLTFPEESAKNSWSPEKV
jgi:hypothetical protein